jgi:hypothetical protein
MIACFIKSGDPEVGELFRTYVWGESGFFTLFDSCVHGHTHAREGLKVILFEFYVEGRLQMWIPKRLSLSNYSPKDRSIGVYVPVTRSVFHTRADRQRRGFIADQLRSGLGLVESRMKRRNFGVDFAALRKEVESVIQLYVEPALKTS